jgi:putative hydrolase of the HAD superfamily
LKKTEKIYFDLDHTLWDYDTNARETLTELFDEFQLDQCFLSADAFIKRFYFVNYQLWDKYNKGEIDRAFIRKNRFREVLDGRKEANDAYFEEMSDYFVHRCPHKPHLMPGALDVVKTLSENYRLGIMTNGFDDVQHIKLEKSGLMPFFEVIITSESSRARKPDVAIFEHALELSSLKQDQVVMVGDNLSTDILGATQAGWHSWWYNPDRQDGDHRHQIYHLKELLDLL